MRVAVYGANGFQGGLTAAELVRRGVQPVLVGRSHERLAATAAGLPSSAVELRTAPSTEATALLGAFEDCDAVINCAGPFTGCAGLIIRAAIAAGCHYVDTSGEQRFVKSVFDDLSSDAQKAGVTVLPSATDGTVPGDLLAHMISRRSGPIDSIIVAHRIVGGGGPSKGSLRSLVQTREDIAGGGLSYEDGAWLEGLPLERPTMAFLAGDDAAVSRFPLVEAVTIPRHVRVRRVDGVIETSLATRLAVPISEQMIEAVQNPSPELRSRQTFSIVLEATLTDGTVVRGTVEGVDTYGTTAAIAVECAKRLAEGQARPGVLAPSQAFEPYDLLEDLAVHDVRWRIDERDRTSSSPE